LGNLELYIEKGIDPGTGLRSVLEGDLFQAYMHLDNDSLAALYNLVKLLWNDVPKVVLGDKGAVKTWMEHRGYEGWADGYEGHKEDHAPLKDGEAA